MELRPYQLDAIEGLRAELRAGKRRLILQASTGAGKTVIASEMIRSAAERGKSVLFVAHARELVRQCHRKLEEFGVRAGIIMRGEVPDSFAGVQVCSKDTLRSWLKRKKIDRPKCDVLFYDEAHRSLGPTFLAISRDHPDAVVIGLTATPARGDGRGLGELYDGMVQVCPMAELIKLGFLVPCRVFAPYRPDLKGLRVTKSDYVLNSLQKRMDRNDLIGDIVDHWKELASDRQTIVFASGVQHSIHLKDQFIAAGVPAAHVDGKTPTEERDDTFRMFLSGDVQVLCNCDVASEGTDLPIASCCVLARPTKSIVKYKQMVGRVMRPWPGKEDALILDHSGCVFAHGFPDEEVPWSLDGRKTIQQAIADNNAARPKREATVCKKCYCAYFGMHCPNCGEAAPRRGRNVQTVDGELVEVNRGKVYEATWEEKQRFWRRCVAIAANRFKPIGMAVAMFSKQFSVPPWTVRPSLDPMPQHGQWKQRADVLFPNYVKHAIDREYEKIGTVPP